MKAALKEVFLRAICDLGYHDVACFNVEIGDDPAPVIVTKGCPRCGRWFGPSMEDQMWLEEGGEWQIEP